MLQRARIVFFGLIALAAAALPSLAGAAELVMFERRGCIWCARWDRDVAPVYGRSDEAKRLPLRRVDLDRSRTGDVVLKEPVIFTPTFVVVDSGREVGRITGYIDDASFWGLLDTLAARLPGDPHGTDATLPAPPAPRT